MLTTEVDMPIIKSSENGEHITVVVFTSDEMRALLVLLNNASYDVSNVANATAITGAMGTLEEFFYALNVDISI